LPWIEAEEFGIVQNEPFHEKVANIVNAIPEGTFCHDPSRNFSFDNKKIIAFIKFCNEAIEFSLTGGP
jgi:hypothetical protein